MKVLSIAFKLIRQNFKNPKGLIFLTLIPLGFMLILGLAFSSLFYAGTENLSLSLLYYIAAPGPLAEGLEAFFPQVREAGISAEEEETFDPEPVRTGARDALVVAHENSLELFINNNGGVKIKIIQGLFRDFVETANLGRILIKHGGSLPVFSSGSFVRYTTLEGTRKPRSIDYFGVTILTMALLFGSHLGFYSVSREKKGRTLSRILTTPVTPGQFLQGTALGVLVLLVFQMIVIFGAGKFLLGVYYGKKILPLMVLLGGECFFVLALGMGTAVLFRDDKAGGSLLSSLIPFLIFLGGGYMKLPDKEIFRVLSWISPVTWLNKACFEQIYTGGKVFFLPALGICLGGGLVILALAGVSVKRRRGL